MHTDIKAVIISDDFVSSAVLSRALKEWWCANVTCEIHPSISAALRSRSLENADVVFVAEVPDEVEMFESIREIHERGPAPMCVVVTTRGRESGRAAALRAGAHACIDRYVASEDDIHRCLWGILRARSAEHLRLLTPLAASAATI